MKYKNWKSLIMKNIFAMFSMLSVVLWVGCSSPDNSMKFLVKSSKGTASAEDVSTATGLLESPAFLDYLRQRLELPRSSDVGGSVDIKSVWIESKKGSTILCLFVEPDIQQPPAPSGKKWFVLKSGSFGTEREDFRLEFPFEECFQAVGEELNDMQRNDAHRLISKKMEALHRTLKNLEERLSDSRQELTLLRQECGIFPPDNQTETMRHVRLLEEKRMELSIQIKAAQNLQKSAAGESSTPLSNQAMAELKNMTHLLAATEQELESANQQAKDELGALGQVEHLNTRIDALTAQRLAVEKEMNQVRSVPVVPQIKLVPLQRE